MALRLKIVTPERVVVDAEATELMAPGVVGEFGVLPEHVTFLGGLDVGVLRYIEGGASKSVVVSGGYAEIAGDLVTILADDATPAAEIDAASARTALTVADQAVQTGADTPEEVDALLAELKKAHVRVQTVS